MSALEQLLAAWRARPDADASVALCSNLGTSGRESLVCEVGECTERLHRTDPRVMLAVGRMYLDAGVLERAEAALVMASEADPRDPTPLGWLGEVLLLGGNPAAARAVLGQALALGHDDPATRMAYERARLAVDEQERATIPRLGGRAIYASIDVDATRVLRPPPSSTRRVRDDSPRAILNRLAAIGLCQPPTAAPASWESPRPMRPRGLWALLLAAVFVLGAYAVTFVQSKRLHSARSELGEELCAQVTRLLESGRVEDLAASNRLLGRVFDLDPSSPLATHLWLKARVLGVLLESDPRPGLGGALARAAAAGAPDSELGTAQIASRLASDDLAGALALAERWDRAASKDALYQLVAGALWERAGDRRAVARYETAQLLDPHLVAADLLLTTLVLLEQGPRGGRPLVQATRRKLGDQPAARALGALLWVVEADPSRPLPADAVLTDDARARLPRPLLAVPHMVRALDAIGTREFVRAREAVQQGLRVVDTAGAAVRLGRLALLAGDEQLAAEAARVAMSRSPSHPGAVALAGRWALVSGRLNDAERAIHLLDLADRQTLGAIWAYEAAAPDALERACDSLHGSCIGRRILAGGPPLSAAEWAEIVALPRPWAILWALDALLDAGNLPKALELVSSGAKEPELLEPNRWRRARLERYRGHGSQALELTRAGAELAVPAPRLAVERVFALVDAGQPHAALDWAERRSNSLGPLGPWLVAFALARSGRLSDARARAADLLPPTGGSVLARLLAARSLAAARDPRAPGYLTLQLRSLPGNPDLLRASIDFQQP